jgi:hypothetical protein
MIRVVHPGSGSASMVILLLHILPKDMDIYKILIDFELLRSEPRRNVKTVHLFLNLRLTRQKSLF